jgi:hypothetical protein
VAPLLRRHPPQARRARRPARRRISPPWGRRRPHPAPADRAVQHASQLARRRCATMRYAPTSHCGVDRAQLTPLKNLLSTRAARPHGSGVIRAMHGRCEGSRRTSGFGRPPPRVGGPGNRARRSRGNVRVGYACGACLARPAVGGEQQADSRNRNSVSASSLFTRCRGCYSHHCLPPPPVGVAHAQTAEPVRCSPHRADGSAPFLASASPVPVVPAGDHRRTCRGCRISAPDRTQAAYPTTSLSRQMVQHNA